MSNDALQQASAADTLSVHVGDVDRVGRRRSPWAWVLSVNYAQGLQYIFVTNLAIAIWFTMGVSPGESAFWAALLGLPWTIKPLWGPLVDRYGTKRTWTILMQFVVGVCFLAGALAMQLPAFFALTVGIFAVVAFAAASHDIACDGFYMLALRERQQAFFVGIRSTCFRLGWVTATGAMPILAGFVQAHTGPAPLSVQARSTIEAHAPVDFEPPQFGADETALGDDDVRLIVEPRRIDVRPGESAKFTVRLSASPGEGETITAIIEHIDGDRSFSIDSATARKEFTAANWDEPSPVTVKLDPRLRTTRTAEFKVASGNIRMSWTVVFVAVGCIFFACAAWHAIVMPRPMQDAPPLEDRPPFHVPLLALLVAVGVPALYCWGMWRAMSLAYGPMRVQFIGDAPSSLAAKGFDFAFATGQVIVLLASIAVILAIRPLRAVLAGGFHRLSDVSRIGFADVFESFFRKPGILAVIGFLLTFRLGEIQVSAISNIFLLASRETGGLSLPLGDWGFVRGVTYVLALLVGGILGGMIIARYGLKRVIWPMVAAVHLPNLCYFWLAWLMPETMPPVHAAVAVEAFGYGLGLPAFLMVMIQAADGPYKTSHYALCTGFMALGAMIPGLFAGFLSELTVLATGNYQLFFLLVMLFCLPGLLFIPFLPIRSFGGKLQAASR